LQEQVDKLQKQIKDADSSAQKQTASYEKLLTGVKAYLADDKIQAAIAVADCKKSDFGSSEAKEIYTTIHTVTDAQIQALLNEGKRTAYTSYDGAIAIYRNVLKLKPKHQDAMYQIGYCYQKKQDNKKAKKWYRKAIKVDPNSAIANKANNYLQQIEQQGTQGQ
jgi:tetratricopeptide (TPR) repeat protein